ncbi:hypothetical protein SAMN05216312_1213 [Cohnella sp. OV330]|uniref:hypothetical protein n=1 Tax=Cohnella sp. OV330 TaxID=1855288 RepID=UPI0008ED5C38|nr:hypothetical protein [Cohnella sp. OV330]SFB62309.1 hypothetical protein SAMN05216312_1213 [Cohnella sp. OV330]
MTDFTPLSRFIDRIVDWRIPWVEPAERTNTVRDLFAMTAGFSFDLTAPYIREAASAADRKQEAPKSYRDLQSLIERA